MRPVTDEQWQDAVDAAHALLIFDTARLYGLVTGGPKVNVELCVEIIEDGRNQGIEPRVEAIKCRLAWTKAISS
jgi:hypothetical protein